jgi:hypothetical protein
VLTEEGLRESERLFEKYFTASTKSPKKCNEFPTQDTSAFVEMPDGVTFYIQGGLTVLSTTLMVQ